MSNIYLYYVLHSKHLFLPLYCRFSIFFINPHPLIEKYGSKWKDVRVGGGLRGNEIMIIFSKDRRKVKELYLGRRGEVLETKGGEITLMSEIGRE